MEMIRISRTEIEEETFCVDTHEDFVYMIEKLLGDEAGRYARQLVEDSYEADKYYEDIQEYEAEIDDYEKQIENLSNDISRLQDKIEKNQKKHSCFIFVKEWLLW